jgi:SAM-dependent methyltransferase
MASKPVKLVRGILKILPKLRALEERTADTRAQLDQLVSHLNLQGALPSVPSKGKTLAEATADTQIQLDQVISLLTIKGVLPPIPPKHLQFRVAGARYPEFFKRGYAMFQELEDVLQSQGQSFFKFNNILDFGCGCGRFMIPLSFRISPEKVSGTDIDKEAIGWFKTNYPAFKDLDVNGFTPPTKYQDGAFDFVYAISIFTHLPEEMQNAWLEELSRIIKPGGYGLFTTHGEKFFAELKKPEYGESAYPKLIEEGFYYSVRDSTEGLPDFYQTSFHTHDYIRRQWVKYFEIVWIQKQGLGGNQDIVLLRKR